MRCDAGAKHGLGHLSRCMTLAMAIRAAGLEPRLVLKAPKAIAGRVVAANLPFTEVGADVCHDDPTNWLSSQTALVVVDSKEATEAYIAACRSRCPVVCFDDEVARNLPCDAVINNNPWVRPHDYPADRLLLLGPAFNTVRPDYFSVSGQQRRGVLVSLGGEDPNDRTSWLVDVLATCIDDLPVHLCIGPAHPDPEAVIAACGRVKFDSTIHRSPPTLVPLAAACHLAISAGGTTCYEFAAAGIAMAVMAIEEHQRRLQSAMVEAGAAVSLGGEGELTSDQVREAIRRLRDDRISTRLAAAGRRMFPAPGADRIVAGLASLIEA